MHAPLYRAGGRSYERQFTMRRRSSNSRISASLPELGTEEIYKSGYQAGYDLGFRFGKEDGRRSFNGTSIIIPAQLPSEDIISTIQKIEALTPHPYELLVADVGSSETTKTYILQRAGIVRHILAKSDEGIIGVLNKAALVANGHKLIVLAGVSPNTDNWIEGLMVELDREASTKAIYVSTSRNEDINSRPNVCCLLFRRKLLSDIGLWNEGVPTLKECLSEWLARIPKQNRIMMEAFDRFS